MTDSFRRKEIDIGILLASGPQTNQPSTFASGGGNQTTLRGHRTSTRIAYAGGAAGSTAQVSVWGMQPSMMAQLSTLGMTVTEIEGNQLVIAAGDEEGARSTVFIGNIVQAIPNYSNQPDTPMRFECKAGALAGLVGFPASSYTGSTDVAEILSALAQSQQWGFRNHGVDIKINNPYLTGSPLNQIKTICRDAGIANVVENNVLHIWPIYGHRESTGQTPLISAPTGMIASPDFTQQGILVRTIFRPEIGLGTQVRVESDILTAQNLTRVNNASGLWVVNRMDISLDSEMPGGLWEQQLFCFADVRTAPIPQRG